VKRSDYDALELDKVLALLARHTSFSASRALAESLEPTTDHDEARRRQAATAEARQLRALRPSVTIGGAHDVRGIVARAAVGSVLQPTELLDVAATTHAAAVLRTVVLAYDEDLPTLVRIAERLGQHGAIVEAVERSIGDNGEVLDGASPELRQVRIQVRGAYDRLMSKLQELLNSPAYRTALQEPLITMREGRYVLPIKVEYRNQVRGIVHDQSASGATLFVEPLAVLDLTNRWREYQIQEEREVERVLTALSHLVGDEQWALVESVEALAELDLHLAMARLADEQRATAPRLRPAPNPPARQRLPYSALPPARGGGDAAGDQAGRLPGPGKQATDATATRLPGAGEDEADATAAPRTGAADQEGATPNHRPPPFPRRAGGPGGLGIVRLVQARHPLLTGEVVPITVELGADFDVLLITGPNTGGKTVALKTIGLLALMAQCGMHLPAAEGSYSTVFDGIYADIGDEQSIEQSLSTFSSHVTRIVDILQEADAGSLVLLDELGAGTDPQEGSALARSILAYLQERGCHVVATTHYSELKSYAHLTPRVENASVEFDVETLSPTYRLSVGLPGRSNALAIATRLGMPEAVIEGARELVSPSDVEVEHLLAEIQRERAAAAAAREAAARAEEDARKLLARRERQVAAVEQEREAIWRRARRESEAMLADLRREVQREVAAARGARTERAPVEEIAERVAELAPVSAPETHHWRRARPTPPARPMLAVGARVGVPGLNARGTVRTLSADGRDAEVEVGGMRVRVKAADLTAPGAVEEAVEVPDPAPVSYTPQPAITVPTPSRSVPLELDLRGQRAAEAAEAVERYLDDAYLAGMPWVRIIHGHGTGAVRQAVRDLLARSSLVRHWAPAEPRQGGNGATEVQLAV
jgi:DNA mismatch repair protein MutS2